MYKKVKDKISSVDDYLKKKRYIGRALDTQLGQAIAGLLPSEL